MGNRITEVVEVREVEGVRFHHAALLTETGEHARAAEEYRVFLASLPHDVPGREKLAAIPPM